MISMTKFALFLGCNIPSNYPQYGSSTKAVLNTLGLEFMELEFNCCGYPIRDSDFKAFLLLSARNIAIAEEQNLDILTPCKCCFGNLMHAREYLSHHPQATDEINLLLEKEGRHYRGSIRIKHLLTALVEDLGLEKLKSRVKRPQHRLKVAAHYGCHALRPSRVVHFDNPFAPTIFENLIRVTGAQPVEWARRLECCGHPVLERDKALSLCQLQNKIKSAADAGADYLCTACTYCQIQFDTIQASEADASSTRLFPSILYTQLLGASLGLEEKDLGIGRNRIQGNLGS